MTGPSPSRATPGPQLLLVLLIVAACAVVAVSAPGFRLILPPADLSPNWIRAIRLLGALGALGAILGLHWWTKKGSRRGVGSGDPVAGSLSRAGIIMALLVLGSMLVNPLAIGGNPHGPGQPPSGQDSPSNRDQGAERSPSSGQPGNPSSGGGMGGGGQGSGGPSSLGAGAEQAQSLLQRLANSLPLNLLLIAAVVLLFLLVRRRRRGVDAGPDFPWGPEDAEDSLLASLAEVSERDGDPRGQITAAYVRLLTALSDAGAPRKAQEAPHEHLYRTLGPLGVETGPLHSLTGLYVMAQFSQRPVTDRHRAAAVEALEVSLASIREQRASMEAELDEGGPPEEAGHGPDRETAEAQTPDAAETPV